MPRARDGDAAAESARPKASCYVTISVGRGRPYPAACSVYAHLAGVTGLVMCRMVSAAAASV